MIRAGEEYKTLIGKTRDTRVDDEPVGEMWSLDDGQDVLAEFDPQMVRREFSGDCRQS